MLIMFDAQFIDKDFNMGNITGKEAVDIMRDNSKHLLISISLEDEIENVQVHSPDDLHEVSTHPEGMWFVTEFYGNDNAYLSTEVSATDWRLHLIEKIRSKHKRLDSEKYNTVTISSTTAFVLHNALIHHKVELLASPFRGIDPSINERLVDINVALDEILDKSNWDKG